DGIRYDLVTGVQTCALPILGLNHCITAEQRDEMVHALARQDPAAGQFRLREIMLAARHALEKADMDLCYSAGGRYYWSEPLGDQDRKSTRLNSSHQIISYAV